ncbi:MAG: hypothetical protein J0H71_17125 [Rhizobiales bacterium]|nr:hypothetical protein [Hyphomicrobiales bacterium]
MSGPLSVPFAIAGVFAPSDLSKALLLGASFICVWAAAFILWRRGQDSLNRSESRVAALNNEVESLKARSPKMFGRVLQYMGGGIDPNKPGLIPIVLILEITNRGELPSVIKNWRATYLRNGTVFYAKLFTPPGTIDLSFEGSDIPTKNVAFVKEDWIPQKASAPITSGNNCVGFLLLYLEGIQKTELPGTVITVQFEDAWENLTSCQVELALTKPDFDPWYPTMRTVVRT